MVEHLVVRLRVTAVVSTLCCRHFWATETWRQDGFERVSANGICTDSTIYGLFLFPMFAYSALFRLGTISTMVFLRVTLSWLVLFANRDNRTSERPTCPVAAHWCIRSFYGTPQLLFWHHFSIQTVKFFYTCIFSGTDVVLGQEEWKDSNPHLWHHRSPHHLWHFFVHACPYFFKHISMFSKFAIWSSLQSLS